MRAHIWGCRGSLAAPGPDTVRYGGNTSCVEVRLDGGELIILDAGTGLRPLGNIIVIMPPLAISLDQLDRICTAVAQGIPLATSD